MLKKNHHEVEEVEEAREGEGFLLKLLRLILPGG
jgi:hypothetical protein